ncbi:MAG: hypothetical protein A2V88_13645 [Elusimicrobia bacterium RBG_16_66_12]|nr:MAG: hypothetical protein A2V88_13645 [Elusimicrobia bacterium RBG_16_66_12]
MIVGGAQEHTMLSCALVDRHRFACELLTGPQTGPEGELHTETRARGVVLHLEPSLVRELRPWKDLVALIRLARFLRRGRYDVVHTNSSKAGILGRIAAAIAKVPVVVHTVHGWGFHPRQSALRLGFYTALERACAPRCDRLIVVNEADRDTGLALRIGRPEQYLLMRSGIEIEAFRDVKISLSAARERLGVPPEAFVVGCVGRLSEQKAPLDLFAAFERVARECPAAHLVMVGDGPLRGAIEARIVEAGLSDRVHLAGLRRDVPKCLRAFDVLALSSRWEGLPRVFSQAMAAGLPIVATRVAGAADAVRDGENGFLVEIGDAVGLAVRLLELAHDSTLRQRLGAAGLARVEEFSARRMVGELQMLYVELLARRGIVA